MKMKRIGRLVIVMVLMLMFVFGMGALKGNATGLIPGSTSDPLVTKSYVDDIVTQIMSILSGTSGTNNTPNPSLNLGPTITKEELIRAAVSEIELISGNTRYLPVSAKTGQIIIGHEGTEIILRSGTAQAYSGVQNGIVNITSGKELYNGNKVDVNNLLIVPRHDSRGVAVTSDAWFLIKGGYDMLN